MKYDSKALESRMQKAITAYENNLADVRASQANAGVLNRVTFDYYGAPTAIKDMASISVSDARTLVITPYDKSTLKAMEKAIQISDVAPILRRISIIALSPWRVSWRRLVQDIFSLLPTAPRTSQNAAFE